MSVESGKFVTSATDILFHTRATRSSHACVCVCVCGLPSLLMLPSAAAETAATATVATKKVSRAFLVKIILKFCA